jgi:hypothetical protein
MSEVLSLATHSHKFFTPTFQHPDSLSRGQPQPQAGRTRHGGGARVSSGEPPGRIDVQNRHRRDRHHKRKPHPRRKTSRAARINSSIPAPATMANTHANL